MERPAALPPRTRTVGQLVAESIRFYGERFWALLPLGVALAADDAVGFHRSVATQTLVLWAFAPVLSAAYVRACIVVTGTAPSRRQLATAFAVALLVFLPFPVLVRLYLLPGLALFALLGGGVPAALVERLGVRAALARGWRLGRADPVHAVGGLATLALVYGLSRYALLVLLHTQSDQAQGVAIVLADLVLSPLLFVGAGLLYIDQAARVD
jgi:hypothetical protein